ncbi:glucose sorbosone dehydrogenase [Rippkaea orientalis PCC 8801]|uniref:Glucose sorbosone dehydrogenase n=1 Tax=Rippkaea orientalis (strain PCC 8801 / RF-1) TaxID=41431 RepID=B7K1L3_RIPO1|nr:PQQ-dependent sugar dehydrogenase [Rippkaea orientalis]ACK67555.1 glucose sorbosone dehydrogenase [Rippkaea orientalis PCC 8801]
MNRLSLTVKPVFNSGLGVLIFLLLGGCVFKTNSTASQPSQIQESQREVNQVTVVEGLEHPWSMAWLPNGDMLITERPGRLRLVKNGVLQPTPIAGVMEVLQLGQGGLMEVSLHPNFSENRLVYFTYAHGTAEANRTRIARATFDGQALRDVQVIFEVTPAKPGGQHFGSRLVWLKDQTMLISIGDGGNPPLSLDGELIRLQAQNLGNPLGKIIRLKDDGSIPDDNPFVGQKEAQKAIWSYGHRNIQGLAVNQATGQIWATEHGSRGGDELNAIKGGQNYGWPLVTHSEEYFGGEISSERSRSGMIDPLIVWTPAIAPSGLAIYQGTRFPQWQGDLFAGGLVGKEVRHIDLDSSGQVIEQKSIPFSQRVRDVKQGPDGFLYVLTDAPNGKLIRLEP